ncbi:heavy-metal-associated domain-containing protein [Robertmurraya andreesenii]|uniref:Copper chaperone CopZ n=1 Tax=Anoxybacillus andreesenii TaxID=1325932 RepID=A0ABT9V3H1_9BACL|nr:heavy metal-associated domain-containing protein [Robertmurraya andreesenii]MDQ0155489.1 copper chaperone CopZ [Robertmurraya andreesenii]
MKRAVFQLEPLTCPSCIKKIESTLNKTSGIQSATVLFNSSKVRVEFDEQDISTEQISKIITKLGYEVR